MPRRIQMCRQHRRKTANTIIADRKTKWSNVFEKDIHGTQAECAAKCARLVLKGCKRGTPCHTELLLKLANR
jgi:hypothetical protein